MALKTSKPARGNGTGSGIAKLASRCNLEHSKTLPQFQAHYLASRFGLAVDRARLVADLAFAGAARG